MDILGMWNRLSKLPLGAKMFSLAVGKFAPYSGTIGAVVRELGPGHAVVELKDRRKVRNHLQSIHAIALMNLAELSSGLSLMCGLPKSMRGILTHLEIDFLKKARGTLRSECNCQIPQSEETRDYDIKVEVKNEAGEIVCKALARWRIGPNKK